MLAHSMAVFTAASSSSSPDIVCLRSNSSVYGTAHDHVSPCAVSTVKVAEKGAISATLVLQQMAWKRRPVKCLSSKPHHASDVWLTRRAARWGTPLRAVATQGCVCDLAAVRTPLKPREVQGAWMLLLVEELRVRPCGQLAPQLGWVPK